MGRWHISLLTLLFIFTSLLSYWTHNSSKHLSALMSHAHTNTRTRLRTITIFTCPSVSNTWYILCHLKCGFMSHVNELGVDPSLLEDRPFPAAHYVAAFESFQAARSSPWWNGGHAETRASPPYHLASSPENTIPPEVLRNLARLISATFPKVNRVIRDERRSGPQNGRLWRNNSANETITFLHV